MVWLAPDGSHIWVMAKPLDWFAGGEIFSP
jgi:hypothetical protein